MIVKLPTEQHLEFLSLKGGCTARLSLHMSKCYIGSFTTSTGKLALSISPGPEVITLILCSSIYFCFVALFYIVVFVYFLSLTDYTLIFLAYLCC